MPSAIRVLASATRPANDGFDIGTMIANEDDDRAARAGNVIQGIGLAVRRLEAERGCRRIESGS